MEAVPRKLFRFLLVGGFCAGVFFAINYFWLEIAGLPLGAALILTYTICFGIGYGLQRNVAFKATSSHRRSLPRYLALHTGGMVFVYCATLWLRPFFGFGSLGAPLIATGLAGFASFVISLTWVFVSPSEPLDLRPPAK